MVYGGIYINKGCPIGEVTEFGIFLSGQSTTWFGVDEHVYQFDQLIEHGGLHELEEVKGYSFGIDKIKKEWHVKDTGHKNCKDILWKGTYEDERFSNGVEKYLKQITGI